MATSDLALEAPIDLPPAHIAAGKNQVEKLTHLIQEGKEVVIDPNTRETVLHAAARNGAIKSAKWIVDSQTVDCSAYASNGYTAAHYAAYYGHLEVLKVLKGRKERGAREGREKKREGREREREYVCRTKIEETMHSFRFFLLKMIEKWNL